MGIVVAKHFPAFHNFVLNLISDVFGGILSKDVIYLTTRVSWRLLLLFLLRFKAYTIGKLF